jgi:hypothetical protein
LQGTVVTTGNERGQSGPSLRVPEHKVSVRLCAGFDCQNAVTTHKVRQNVHGHREYCSLFCYARWSPAMRTTITAHQGYAQSPAGLEKLILELKEEHGIGGAAEILGFSRSTVTYWLRKLAGFRAFAGQSPEAILGILHGIAQDPDRGINTAASLVGVDPKTLQRAFDKMDYPTQQAA